MRIQLALILCLFATICAAQHILQVKRPLWFYQNVPNPVDIAKFGYDPEDVSLTPIDGEIDTINGTIYWTPFSSSSSLVLRVRQSNHWLNVDTLYGKNMVISSDQFVAKIEPITRHAGLPDLKRFKNLTIKLKESWELVHLDIGNMAKLISYDAFMYDSSSKLVDSVSYSINMEIGERMAAIQKIRDIESGQKIRFTNIHFECSCWPKDQEYKKAIITDDVWATNWHDKE